MRYEAVIFDLFGTLAVNLPTDEYSRLLREIAALVEVPGDDFARAWVEKMDDRMVGKFGGGAGNIAAACSQLGLEPDPVGLREAVRIRQEFTRRNLQPRQNALKTLRTLRSLGLMVGLISDCTDEVPTLWDQTPFAELIDHPLFSCSVGVKKPDPSIYHLACEGLGVVPEKCLYIGDGASDELDGATHVGMDAALILPEGSDDYDRLRSDAWTWMGPVIADLSEVTGLLDARWGDV